MYGDRDVAAYWDGYAPTWVGQAGEAGDYYHRTFLFPAVLRLLGDVRGLRVLDIACGTGTLSRRLARAGGVVTAVDISAGMLEAATALEKQEPLSITYAQCSASDLRQFRDGSFDSIVCNMALMDISDYAGAMREAFRVARSRGRFVFSMLHPCFCTPEAGWVVRGAARRSEEDKRQWNVDRYFERQSGKGLMEYAPGLYFHRTLADYLNALLSSGFTIERVEEPEPEGSVRNERPDMLRIAEFLVVASRKA